MGYQDLAYAIVKQAVCDYRENKANGKSVSHISRFFNSDWCTELLGSLPLTGKDILHKLKSEPVKVNCEISW